MDKNSSDYIRLTNDVRKHRKAHWESVYLQAQPAVCLDIHSVFEIGPGRGLLKAILKHYSISYTSVDIANRGANPDFIGDFSKLKFKEKYDMICSFETLEHNPPEKLLPMLEKMSQMSNRYVYISLPFNGRWISGNIAFNFFGFRKFLSFALIWRRIFYKRRPLDDYRKHKNPYKHHWFEVGEPHFTKAKMRSIFDKANLTLIESRHSNSHPEHLFFLLEKRGI